MNYRCQMVKAFAFVLLLLTDVRENICNLISKWFQLFVGITHYKLLCRKAMHDFYISDLIDIHKIRFNNLNITNGKYLKVKLDCIPN